ncbi:LPS-assembly protein [Alteromonadaceae bacterium 2753L.S.0a.02]|nr:LPS-assembly protein [Alteromonadaceae bacterium 2753L.S.0a.02]
MPKPPARHKRPRLYRRAEYRSILGICLSVTALSGAAQETSEFLYDWHPKETLTEEQKEQVGPGCDGLYIDPTRGKFTAEDDNYREIPLVIEADSSELREGEVAELRGDVQVTQGSRTIGADRMIYSISDDTAALEGNVSIRQPGLLLRGSGASANGVDHSAEFNEALFVLHEQHLRGAATTIRQTSDKVIELENGSYTSCEPNNKTWVLEGEKITIDTNSNWGVGHNVKLKIHDIPLIYLPYITFPVGDERKSGFLFPSVNISERNGLDVSTPYYWNAAPNYDMTITPRYIGKRGGMLELEGRHLSKQFSNLANVAFLANDRGGRIPNVGDAETTEQAVPYKGEDRWLGHFHQNGGLSRGWFTQVEYTQVSDNDYFRDLGTSSFTLQNTTHLDQSFIAGVQLNNWQIRGLAQDYQVLLYDVNDPYQRLPQINIDGNYQLGEVTTVLKHELTRFDHGDNYWRDGRAIIKGSRLNTDYRIATNQRLSWGFFQPQLGVQSLHYQFDEDTISATANSHPTLVTSMGSLDTGLIFEHPGGKILQTLEPRIFYLYRSYTDHSELFGITDDGQNVNFDTSARTFSYAQLYRDSRFIGGDRLGDANRMTVGLTSNWSDQASNEEYFSISLGQIIYFDDQRVSLNEGTTTVEKSEFAGDMRLRLGSIGRLYANAVYDSEEGLFNRGGSGIQIATANAQSLFNLGYNYIRRETASSTGIDQIDTSFVTPVSKQWHLMGRYNYDFGSKTELETFVGLEYNDCCYRIRLLARRWLDSNIAPLAESSEPLYDSGLFFYFNLKGLGSSGERVNAILEDSIYGYREREKFLNQ